MLRRILTFFVFVATFAVVRSQDNHPPYFARSLYTGAIKENNAVGASVLTVSALDSESNPITYSLGGAANGLFTINASTGIIQAAAVFDLESGPGDDGWYQFVVKAADSVSKIEGSATVIVEILDVNDNAPAFQNAPYTATVSENANPGLLVATALASDKDRGLNAQFVFSFEDKNQTTFNISRVSGRIVLAKSLDYEKRTSYFLTIVARDNASPYLSSKAGLHVTVTDFDDQSPKFNQSRYVANPVSEAASIGFSIMTVSATDQDAAIGNPVSYSFNPAFDASHFKIDAASGLITLQKSLDYETKTEHILLVQAAELGSSSTPALARVDVRVINVNDNSPKFVPSAFSADLVEDANIGDFVVGVTAADNDKLPYNQFVFNISQSSPDNGRFAIDSTQGILTLAKTIDYESGDTQFTVLVTVQDIHPPGASDTATVTVNIIDVNDNNPKFEKAVYAASQDENTPAWTSIVRPLASDKDTGQLRLLIYSIFSGNDLGHFTINSSTAVISNAQVLDREKIDSYTLAVEAADALGAHRRLDRCVVNVAVNDLNDNSPIFGQSTYTATVTENNANGVQIATLVATDEDFGTNSLLKYAILSGNSLSAFEIRDSASGIVTARLSLDYEQLTSYNLTIEARDSGPSGGRADTATLVVTVLDQNDNSPIFSKAPYSYSVAENGSPGQLIGTVEATDADSGSYGKISYSLAGVFNERFDVNSTTGEITTAQSIDREDPYGELYRLLVIAEDQPTNHKRRTTAQLTVTITDENDNSPAFALKSYQATISENVVHSNFLTVSASDPDKGINSQLTFSIIRGNNDSLFAIDSKTGDVSTTGQPDREITASYSLLLQVEDGGGLTDTATLTVNIRDVNDNNPVFDLLVYSRTISENDPIGDEVVRVRATEKDVGSNAAITYSITAGSPSAYVNSFGVGLTTGSITTKGVIDYETVKSFILTVTATDGDGNTGTCTVNVTIADFNDNAPTFKPALYQVSIDENSSTGTSVAEVTATDADSGLNGALVFSIISGDDGVFEIDAVSGEINVASTSPDYESKKFYTIDVQAQDQANPSSDRLVGVAKVEVTINDVNDNPPIFSDASYAFQLVESAGVGTTIGLVSASDADSLVAGNGVVTYSIAKGNDGTFRIGSSSGILTLAGLLDHEKTPAYNLTVVASDGGKMTDTASVSFTVLDINDNPPKFAQSSYSTDVDENVDLNTLVLTMTATEKDSDRAIAYSLTGGNGRFNIESSSGKITTANSIDYEEVKSYSFQITAEDNGNPPRRSSVPVVVNVNDKNDNRPVFAQPIYRAALKENQGSGLSIATVSATDADSSTNAALTYSIASGNNASDFRIDSNTGLVSTASSLDREKKSSYSLQIQAADGGNPTLTAVASVLVDVEDVNDNSPVFDPPTYADKSLAESTIVGTVVETVTAKDADLGVNAKIIYSLRNGDGRFQVDRASGEITTVAALNREMSKEYDLAIVATDSALVPLSASVQVKVIIADENDNAPVFTRSSYSGTVAENTAEGASIAQVSANDADDGVNGEIVYALVDDLSSRFKINATTGEVQTGSATLDREAATSHTLTVRASDRGSPTKTATTTVQVAVTDKNDVTPSFSAARYATSVSELALVGTTVVTVTASDGDVGTNAQVVYAFADLSSINVTVFSIDSASGVVKTTSALNADVKKEYRFAVKATDKGSPTSLSSTATVTVTVQDVNDNDPTFNKSRYAASVYENMPKGTTVVTVSASEADSGVNAKITYSITFGGSGKFLVNPTSGVVSTTGLLDRESVAFYTLTVTAKDQGVPPRSGQTTVEITVLDTNDQRPVFEFSLYAASVPEGPSGIGTLVSTVSASDGDIGTNKQIKYSITGGNSEGIFSIPDPNVGRVTTVKSLDREATPQSPAYVLNVTATDQGAGSLTGVAQLQVTVTDVNDNSPVFTKGGIYSATIPENLPGGSSVVLVAASDADVGSNAAVTFSVVSVSPSVGSSQFTMDSDSGLLQTDTVGLDYEREKAYTLTVRALDGGKPQNNATAVISITITDVNDNAPVFQNLPYKMTLAEGSSSLGSVVATLVATDKDSGTNGQVVFSFISGNDDGLFALNKTAGTVTVAQSLDYETSQSHTLTVRAEDQNGAGNSLTRQSATAQVTVTVTDINDNAPVFSVLKPVTIPENSLVGQPVVTLTATDADSSSNGDVTFAITKGNTDSDFTLDATKGTVLIANSLDVERTARYDLEVTATDKGVPAKSAVTIVEINIADVNDNPPVFAKSSYSVAIDEGTYAGKSVETVVATDSDSGVNGLVRYNITSGDSSKVFEIDRTSGKITATGTLDRETISSYDLTITATDQALDVRSGTTRVLITLNDVNDNAPIFVEKSYAGTMNENALPSKSVNMPILVKATDADIGSNKIFTFSLSGPGSGNFTINNKTGVVQTSTSVALDRESKDNYDLTLTVTDSGLLASSVPLRITITDENDNSPTFNPDSYVANIVENSTVGFSILTVTASDLDLGANAQIHFGIVSGAKFQVDPTTGVVSVGDDLNRELRSRYVLNVSATDGGQSARRGYAPVIVHIVDVNDNAPTFDALSYAADIREDVAVGSFVLDVDASDLDSGVNGELRYDLIDGGSGDANRFVVNASSGEIRTRLAFDRETKADYTFSVRATDNGQPSAKSATASVKIQVTDVNDNDPVFTQRLYRTDALESTANNSILLTVAATDVDLGLNGEVVYYIGNDTHGLFHIENPKIGSVVLRGALDHETRSRLSFVVEARDRGDPYRSSLATVEVNVLDVNDNNPVFTKTNYRASVDENLPPGQSLLTVNATEKDASVITYSISAGNSKSLFQIDTNTGLVSTNASLDREEADIYTLSLTAQDDDVVPRIGRTTVVIRVLDKNDNSPEFPFSNYQTSLLEDSRVGSVLSLDGLSATDDDVGQNAVLAYRLESVGNVGNVFRINSTTAAISTSGPLDRETQSSYRLTVTVSDSGSPSFSSSVNVSVVVGDVNDHTPQFVKPFYSASIREDVFGGYTVTTVSSTDEDIGPNGLVSYAISDGDAGKFRISPSSGVVSTIGSLDYESVKSYNMTIMASDSGVYPGPRNSSVKLSVTIQDVNDNKPIFTPSLYSATLRENVSIGNTIATLSASDLDSGVNGIVRFNKTGGDPYDQFSVDPVTGVVLLTRSLDYENTTSYRLNVVAYDGGTPVQTATTEVTITVTDVNDNSPIFFPAAYASILSEATSNNSVVLVLTATDRDHGTNADLSYQITTGNDENRFGINSKSGEIYTVASLDREVTDSYVLEATVTDSPTNPHSVKTRIDISVSDYNDNSPVFSPRDHQIVIPEDFAVNGTLKTVNATDADIGENGRVTYQITSGDDGLFVIDGNTGLISTTGMFDRETQALYQLFIQGRDHGRSQVNTGFGTLTVTISDINDNSPYFEQSLYDDTVAENSPIGTAILSLAAKDLDIGVNKIVNYSIVETDVPFGIDSSTGQVYTTAILNRESRHNYTFTVVAENSLSPIRLSGRTTIFIHVIDVNDNPPQFVKAEYKVSISELLPLGTTIVTVSSFDIDIGEAGTVVYSIVDGDPNTQFRLADPEKGEIVISSSLDAEKQASYNLTIQARDNGPTRLYSLATVLVTIFDENDNSPVFQSKSYTFSHDEDLSVDWAIGRVAADDSDQTPKNQQIVYEIIQGNEQGTFGIADSSGIIVLVKSLDYETTKSYTLTVRASNAMVGVPKWPNIEYPRPILESRRRRRAVANATDVPPTTTAAVSPTSASTTSPPTIRPTVENSWHLNDTATVRINVVDVNDNYPIFPRRQYTAGVPVDAELDSHIRTVVATDLDSGNYSTIRYSLATDSGEASRLFRVDPVYGRIYTASAEQFFGKEGEHYVVQVRAYDNFGRVVTHSNEATVTIYVLTPSQQVLMVLGVKKELVTAKQDLLDELLENITGLIVNIDKIQSHKEENVYDTTQTDVFLHAIDPTTNVIVPRDEVIKILDKNLEVIYSLLSEFNVTRVIPAQPVEKNSVDIVRLSLIIAASVIAFILILILIIVCCERRKRNKKRLHTTLIGDGIMFGSPPSTLQLEPYDMGLQEEEKGNTITKENPIWVDPYDTWIEQSQTAGSVVAMTEDEDDDGALTKGNPLYESQEIKMTMFVDTSDAESSDSDNLQDRSSRDNLLADALDEPSEVSTTAI